MASAKTLKNDTKIKVINNTRGSLSFEGVDDKKYSFPKPNSYKSINLEVIEALYADYPQMLLDGYILIEDKKVYDYLDIPEDVSSKLVPKEYLKNILQQNADELGETLDELPLQIKENIATVAKESKIDSMSKVKVIKEKTGFDVTPEEE